jgi:hypothetical protein
MKAAQRFFSLTLFLFYLLAKLRAPLSLLYSARMKAAQRFFSLTLFLFYLLAAPQVFALNIYNSRFSAINDWFGQIAKNQCVRFLNLPVIIAGTTIVLSRQPKQLYEKKNHFTGTVTAACCDCFLPK